MIKHVLLGAAALISVPALAQQTTAPGGTMTGTPGYPSTPGAPAQTAPSDMATQPAPSAQTAPADTTASQPAASGDQVAAVVDQEFPSYDKDSNGALSQAEFGEWMGKLKAASEPAEQQDEQATKTWVNAAFAQADTDKSKSVTKPELLGFLSQGQS